MELELWRKEVTCIVRMRKRAPRRSELRRIGRWNVVLGFKCVKYTRANELKQKFFRKIGSTVSPELKKLIRDGKCLVKFLIFLRLFRVTIICRCIEFAFHAGSLLNWNSLFSLSRNRLKTWTAMLFIQTKSFECDKNHLGNLPRSSRLWLHNK